MSETNDLQTQKGMDDHGCEPPANLPGSMIGTPMHSLTVAKQKNILSKLEEEEILKEVCVNNGINYNKVSSGGEESNNVDLLEIFFAGYPKMVGLNNFSNLRKLIIINQPSLQKIEGLVSVPKLSELWICECDLRKIEQLQYVKHLRKLYLYCNRIEVIENLDDLTELEVLWLNQNLIFNIENISSLTRLKQLNLAENRIERIGHTLDSNQRLEDLNLSGNKISSLRDLTNLMRLPSLCSLSLKDPLYTPAPVSLLCNYATHVLYHLPSLVKLDTYDIAGKNTIELAETTVIKKKMYYNMRIHTVHRNLAQVIAKMNVYQQQILSFPHERLRTLINAIKEIEMDQDHTVSIDQNNALSLEASKKQLNLQKLNSSPNYSTKLAVIKERVKNWEKRCTEIEAYYTEMVQHFKDYSHTLVNRMVVELESGGNVRFEEGTPSDMWFTSCHDLVLSRFCAADYQEHGIMGIKVRRIIRIHNRILRTKFDDKLTSIVDDSEGEYSIANRSVAYKKLLEYLFWMWDPSLAGGSNEPERILEEGFMDADTYTKLGRDGAVPLSNSLSLADRHRINYLISKNRGKEAQEFCPFKFGNLIISKVYLGKNAKVLDDKLISQKSYAKLDAVFRPKKMCVTMEKNVNNTEKNACECSARQCEWFIFDHELVLPEYIVEYEYITKMKAKSPFMEFSEVLLDNNYCMYPSQSFEEEGDKMVDDDILNMEPQTKSRPRLIFLTDELLLKLTGQEQLENITVLNLHGNGLSKLKQLQSLKMLKRLVVSFNDLCKIEELSYLGLEQLDASFNKITTLDGLKGLHKLRQLDLSWNKMTNTKDELSILGKHMPNLNTLDVRHNPWEKPDSLRLRIIGRLKSVTVLNGVSVTESDTSAALRIVAGSRISQLSLLTFSRTDQHRPRSLSLMSMAQILCSTSRNKPEKLGEHDNQWYSKITALNLDNQHISKLSSLEKLEHLKYATFINNDIIKIEGLDNCMRLEELSLENNCIRKLEGLSKLTQLQRLNVSQNLITSIDTNIHYLVHLHYLALDNNLLTSVIGLQNVSSLVELYIGNNQIANIRDVFHLKSLANLVILEMFGNPVASGNDNYRLFVIYHLRTLKAFDGSAIEATEGNNAKDMFGGRLTPDFVAEKLGHSNFLDVRELDLPNNAIRIIDLGAGDFFPNLRSVNLEHNSLTSFSGLINLPNLRVLCLNHNRIECVVQKQKVLTTKQKTTLSTNQNSLRNGTDLSNTDSAMTPMLENLEVLHLGYNCIKDMGALQLSRLTGLKALFLQGNEIQKIEGMEGLHDLRELVLDRNKIKNIGEASFVNQWNLQELHLEENRLRELANISCLENLQRLYLGSNRIQEVAELENIDGLQNLIEISVVNNPSQYLDANEKVCNSGFDSAIRGVLLIYMSTDMLSNIDCTQAARRHLHRPLLVFRLKNMMIIDGIPVTDEERAKAELYFMDQQPTVANQGAADGSLPGIGQYKAQIPVKVTNMQLATSPLWNGSILYDDPTFQDNGQRGAGRRRSKQSNGENIGGPAPLGRTNTMYQQAGSTGTGYGGFAYTTSGNRAQFYLNQIPYIAAQSSQTAEMNNSRNNRK